MNLITVLTFGKTTDFTDISMLMVVGDVHSIVQISIRKVQTCSFYAFFFGKYLNFQRRVQEALGNQHHPNIMVVQLLDFPCALTVVGTSALHLLPR